MFQRVPRGGVPSSARAWRRTWSVLQHLTLTLTLSCGRRASLALTLTLTLTLILT